MRHFLPLLALVLAPGCAHLVPRATLEQQLLDADAAFARDVAARGLEAWVEAFAPDGAMLGAGGPRVVGHVAIREEMAALGDPRKAPPALRLEWWPKAARVSDDGTLGYTIGNAVVHGAAGDRKTKYLTVWRRQPDGVWKAEVDIGNAGWAVEP